MSLNKALLICHVGKDPELTYTQGGSAICKMSVATTEKWSDKNTGEKKEKTEWHRVSFFGKQAETVGQYVKKGSQLYVEGRIQTSEYEKNGEKRYSTEIIASSFQFLDRKPEQQPRQQGFEPAQQSPFAQNGFNQRLPAFTTQPDEIPF